MVSLFLVSLVTAFGPPAAPSAATVTHSGADYTLANGFVQVVFATTGAHGTQLRSLKGDFAGAGNYGEVRRIGLADDRQRTASVFIGCTALPACARSAASVGR